jgi:hypothetical protein
MKCAEAPERRKEEANKDCGDAKRLERFGTHKAAIASSRKQGERAEKGAHRFSAASRLTVLRIPLVSRFARPV